MEVSMYPRLLLLTPVREESLVRRGISFETFMDLRRRRLLYCRSDGSGSLDRRRGIWAVLCCQTTD